MGFTALFLSPLLETNCRITVLVKNNKYQSLYRDIDNNWRYLFLKQCQWDPSSKKKRSASMALLSPQDTIPILLAVFVHHLLILVQLLAFKTFRDTLDFKKCYLLPASSWNALVHEKLGLSFPLLWYYNYNRSEGLYRQTAQPWLTLEQNASLGCMESQNTSSWSQDNPCHGEAESWHGSRCQNCPDFLPTQPSRDHHYQESARQDHKTH